MDSVQQGSDINRNETVGAMTFRTYEDGFTVRAMMPDDAKIVQRWYSGMGRICRADLEVTLSVFPPGHGFYIGEKDGEVIASAIRIPWGPKVFYGSLYYVDEAHRGKGYGTRLRDEVARKYVANNMLCVDAVEGSVASKNAAKFGYTYGFKTGRFEGTAKVDFGKTYADGKIVKASDVRFEHVVSYDDKHFLAAGNPIRRAFLEKWLKVEGGGAYVALDSKDTVVGYGQRRPCIQENNHQVGPIYADQPQIAEALLQALMADVTGDRVTLNIWYPNEGAVKMVEDFGMEKVFSVDRMHVNGDPMEFKNSVFALTSIDVCGF